MSDEPTYIDWLTTIDISININKEDKHDDG